MRFDRPLHGPQFMSDLFVPDVSYDTFEDLWFPRGKAAHTLLQDIELIALLLKAHYGDELSKSGRDQLKL